MYGSSGDCVFLFASQKYTPFRHIILQIESISCLYHAWMFLKVSSVYLSDIQSHCFGLVSFMGVPNNHTGFILPIPWILVLRVLSDTQYKPVKYHVIVCIGCNIIQYSKLNPSHLFYPTVSCLDSSKLPRSDDPDTSSSLQGPSSHRDTKRHKHTTHLETSLQHHCKFKVSHPNPIPCY